MLVGEIHEGHRENRKEKGELGELGTEGGVALLNAVIREAEIRTNV